MIKAGNGAAALTAMYLVEYTMTIKSSFAALTALH